MIDELRESIYREFPEVKGEVYIFNQLAPLDEEIKRAEKELKIDNFLETVNKHFENSEYKFPDITGLAFQITNSQGKQVSLTMAEDPKANYIEQDNKIKRVSDKSRAEVESYLTPENIKKIAWHNLHEAGHGLQAYRDEWRKFHPELIENYIEGGAEVFAYGLLAHNGLPKDYVYQSAARYDDILANKPLHIYDPSQAMLSFIRNDTPIESDIQDYNLKDVKSVFVKAHETVKYFTGNEEEQNYHAAQARSLEQAVKNLHSRGFTDTQVTDWILERKDIISQANQIAAGKEYQKNPVGEYKGFQPANFSLEQAAGRAALHFQATKDPADEILAKNLLKWFVRIDSKLENEAHLKVKDVDVLMHSNRWSAIAERMANGEKIESVTPDLKEFIDNQTNNIKLQIPIINKPKEELFR